MKHKSALLPLLLVAAAGLAVRLILAAAQLPYHYQADEFQVIERALRVGTGQFNPGLYTWPGSLVIYLNFIAVGGYYAALKVLGHVKDAAAFAELYWRAPGAFYYIGRAISSIFGAAAVVAAGRWTARATTPGGGFVAAAVVAFAPAAVAASAVALPDMAAVALGTVALAAAGAFMAEGRVRLAVAAGVALGLGAAAKYHVLLYVPALAAALTVTRAPAGVRARAAAFAAVSAVIAFLVACPSAVLDGRRFAADVGLMLSRPGFFTGGPGWRFTVGTALPETFGWPYLVLAAFGAAVLAVRRDRFALVVTLAAAPILVAALFRPLPPRHLLIAVPPLAAAAGAFYGALAGERPRANRALAITLVTALIGAALALNVAHIVWAAREDTRTAAARYCERALPAAAPLVLTSLPPDVDNPPLWPTRPAMERLLAAFRASGTGSPGRYEYFLKTPAFPFGHKPFNTYVIGAAAGPRPRPAYALLCRPDDRDYFADQVLPFGAPASPAGVKYANLLERRGKALRVFDGRGRPGPTIILYSLP